MRKPIFISENLWKKLSFKEIDYIEFKTRGFSKEKIMRKLYINTRQGYHKFEKKVREKIKNDVNKVYKIN